MLLTKERRESLVVFRTDDCMHGVNTEELLLVGDILLPDGHPLHNSNSSRNLCPLMLRK